jgi:diguanylate cyclase (GGDEF)-like protein
MRDALTRVYNRRYFDQQLNVEISYATRHASPVAVLMLDIDYFKKVNDEHGHNAGDAVLIAVAAELAKCVRTEDVVARLGGEEFALIVRSDAKAASLLAERIRARIEALTVHVGGRALRVTVSIGVASLDCIEAGEGSAALVGCADRRLYRAKQLGRNGVCKAD